MTNNQDSRTESAREAIIHALVASKGWTHGYAGAFLDDYVGATAPQPAPAPAPAPAQAAVCTWTLNDFDGNNYKTQCGNLFEYNDGGPKENDAKYCCYCGLTLKATP